MVEPKLRGLISHMFQSRVPRRIDVTPEGLCTMREAVDVLSPFTECSLFPGDAAAAIIAVLSKVQCERCLAFVL